MKPVVAIYSTFLQRGYDQLIHDVAIQNLPVLFALDRGGLVGGDGATHNGAFDYAYLRTVPNLTVMAPSDDDECRQMLFTGFNLDGPSAVRYPRGAAPGDTVEGDERAAGRQGRDHDATGKRVAILAFGAMLKPALEAGEALDATVANMRFVKPLDAELVEAAGEQRTSCWSRWKSTRSWAAPARAVCEALRRQQRNACCCWDLPDRFIDHGDPGRLLASVGLDAAGIQKVDSRT